jgi:hypothetical protein
MLQDCITAMLAPPPTQEEQRVELFNDQQHKEAEQWVIDATPILTILQITDAPGIMDSWNPTNKRALKANPQTHLCMTWNNMPGIMPAPISPATYTPIPSGARQRLVTQHAINALTCNKREHMNLAFIPKALLPSIIEDASSHIEHFTLPMVYPVTDENISSYKKLMNDPAMAEIWQTAFGKDFGGMEQGDNKTGQKGTIAMFIMTHNEIKHVL